MKLKHCLILAGVLLTAVTHAQKPADTNTAGAALHALFDREWEWELTQDPLWASYLGDRRWNDRWEDISAERARRATGAPGIGPERSRGDPARSALACRPPQLRPVPPSVSDGGRGLSASAAPDSHLDARAACRARSSSSTRCAFRPSRTSTTGSRGSTRSPRYMDQNIALMREGMKTNVLLPKIIAERVRPQIAQLATQAPEQSGYYRPFRTIPASLPAADRERLAKAGARARPLARAAGIREAARVHGSRVPAGVLRRRRLVAHEQRARGLSLLREVPHDDRSRAAGDSRARAEGSGAHPRRDGGDQEAGRLHRARSSSSSRTCGPIRSSSTRPAKSCSTAIAPSQSGSIPSSSRSAASCRARRTASSRFPTPSRRCRRRRSPTAARPTARGRRISSQISTSPRRARSGK